MNVLSGEAKSRILWFGFATSSTPILSQITEPCEVRMRIWWLAAQGVSGLLKVSLGG
jgi:hypothetical protein